MANYKTGAQRYNDRMERIFKKSEELGNHSLHGSTEYPNKKVARSKALEAKKEGQELKEKHQESFKKGRTNLNWKQSRSLMRHVNKPN